MASVAPLMIDVGARPGRVSRALLARVPLVVLAISALCWAHRRAHVAPQPVCYSAPYAEELEGALGLAFAASY